jgi:hypothetical protein
MNKSNLDYYATKEEFYYQLIHSLSQHHGAHGGESLPGMQGNCECGKEAFNVAGIEWSCHLSFVREAYKSLL